MEALLNNNTLISPTDDSKITLADAFNGVEAIGFYFSAHWCGPCRNFTPRLSEFYKEINSENKRFEIVFLSSDRDENSFAEYRKSMPWLALDIYEGDNATLKEQLSAKYGVRGIPSLVILSPDGELITKDGRSGVSNPEDFPWVPKTFWEILAGEIVDNQNQTYDAQSFLTGKEAIAVYFSAHWCGPCQNFTPKLIETYNALKASGKDFEVVFASSDRSKEQFNEYFGTMPWKAIPYGDKRKEELSAKYEVQGIPTLIILDPATGKILNEEGVGRVSGDPTGSEFPWPPKPLYHIDEAPGNVLNEKPTLIAFNKSFTPEFIEGFKQVAASYVERFEQQGEEQKLYFVYADESHQMYGRLSGFLNLTTDTPVYILLNLAIQKKSILPNPDLNSDTLNSFAEAYLAGALEFVPYKQ